MYSIIGLFLAIVVIPILLSFIYTNETAFNIAAVLAIIFTSIGATIDYTINKGK